MRGGQLSKARRGELVSPLPIGLVYDPAGKVVLDPDTTVRQAIAAIFELFDATGSATGVVKAFNAEGLRLPRRTRHGPDKGKVMWSPAAHSRILQILHNPRYAGAFFYGRYQHKPTPGTGKSGPRLQPREQWVAFFPDHHPGYITLAEYDANQDKLTANAAAHGKDRRHGPPREGPALLQGIVVCGICGRRMTVRYHQRKHGLEPEYICQAKGIEYGNPICQRVHGAVADTAVGELLVTALTPHAVQAALAVADELAARADEADTLRAAAVQRAQYQADLARRRYLAIDPDNRLVATSLEADWNAALRELAEATETYQKNKAAGTGVLDDDQRTRITALAGDFPRLWSDPDTRTASASAWCGCWSPTSPCSAPTRSLSTSGCPAARSTPWSGPSHWPPGRSGRLRPRSLPPSTHSSTITPTARSPRSSPSAATSAAPDNLSPPGS
ncbi:recombinase family protein [Streptomyces sioyaensis]|uniref:recombinase family protein n=1 Tax=Streptomyces sioyaensis TaxID=67364 RepID=UPI0033F10664